MNLECLINCVARRRDRCNPPSVWLGMSLNWKSALDTRNTTLDRKGGRERVRYVERGPVCQVHFSP